MNLPCGWRLNGDIANGRGQASTWIDHSASTSKHNRHGGGDGTGELLVFGALGHAHHKVGHEKLVGLRLDAAHDLHEVGMINTGFVHVAFRLVTAFVVVREGG